MAAPEHSARNYERFLNFMRIYISLSIFYYIKYGANHFPRAAAITRNN